MDFTGVSVPPINAAAVLALLAWQNIEYDELGEPIKKWLRPTH